MNSVQAQFKGEQPSSLSGESSESSESSEMMKANDETKKATKLVLKIVINPFNKTFLKLFNLGRPLCDRNADKL